MSGVVAFLPFIGKVFDRIFPDPEKARQAKIQIEELAQKGDLADLDAEVTLAIGQMEVNREEAKHSSIFVAGWRPFVGWVCGIALLYSFILLPFLNWGAFMYGVDVSQAPKLNTGELMTVLLGMLGLTGARSYEKRNGVARASL